MGADKLWIDLWGRPVWRWSLDAMLDESALERIAVVHPAGAQERFATGLPPRASTRCLLVEGGEERLDSVLAGLLALTESGLPADAVVLVHDAARPAVSRELIGKVLAAARGGGGAVPVLAVPDTLKRVVRDGDRLRADETVDRFELAGAQTPQAGQLGELRAALEAARRAGQVPTDDVAALAAAGVPIHGVAGEAANRKLTEPGDEELLRAVLRSRALPIATDGRVGLGFDAHRLTEGRALHLGGLEWPDEPRGLAGHSDGDAGLHAVTDALLGAAGLGDIGSLFPADDRWAGADSAELLGEALERIRAAGLVPSWVDLTVVGERPIISPRRDEMRARIAAIVNIDPAAVSVKGTTSDGLGFAGSEGIAAYAVAGVAGVADGGR
jgi:2-C-methyl-D-erythritol 4-phosphate cytidylyltransferase / 2-C-methyl-D-erythritol 2,4-cyclodiphosphate synthase